jgi:hypothetical protein
MSQWSLYIIRTINGDLYTGITTDVDRRFAEHQAGGKKSARCLYRLLHLYIRRHFRYNVIIRFTGLLPLWRIKNDPTLERSHRKAA